MFHVRCANSAKILFCFIFGELPKRGLVMLHLPLKQPFRFYYISKRDFFLFQKKRNLPSERMCGIFGYLNFNCPKSRREILQTMVNGLKRMEYRGYDSAGKYQFLNTRVKKLKN